jgi:YidC/Oxa1 family membrane protein insertase
MIELWNTILLHPFINLLIGLDRITGNLGWSIILLTVGLRLIMTPLVLPSLRLSQKMQELAPELAKLKEKHKDDKTALLTAQTQLYKDHGANPASGCLPQIIQLIVLIALYSAFNTILRSNGADVVTNLNSKYLYSYNHLPANFNLSTSFAYLNLTKPDTFKIPGLSFPLPGIFLIAAAAVQLLSSKMMAPVIATEKKLAEKTSESMDDAMVQAQQQMLYLFPLMTLIIGFNFPAGLVLYWFVFSAVSMFQQYSVTGWGGLAPWLKKAHLLKS